MDYVNNPWFAGFADGESHFGICKKGCPRFMIALRMDDLAILEALAEAFGGAISLQMGRKPWPNASWCVASKRDLAKIVAYFDQFPLRSKKARDYTVWRRAAVYYIARGGSSRRGVPAAELMALREALMIGRAYDGDSVPDVPVIEDGSLQFDL